MKKFIILLTILFLSPCVNSQVLEAGVSIENVPKALYGTWRVNAKLDRTNSYKSFRPQGVDYWNLSRNGDVVNLNNPNTGADADVLMNNVEGNLVIFTKTSPFDNNKVLTDKVSIRIEGNKFSGINELKLESYSLIDNSLMKTETAVYLIEGEKVAGESIIEE